MSVRITTIVLIFAGIVLALGIFFLGTVVGFDTAITQLSKCEQVPCEQLGVTLYNGTVCETCPDTGVLRVRGRG